MAHTEIQEIPTADKKTHLYSAGGSLNTGTGCTERSWSLHPWSYSNPGCSSWPCKSRGWAGQYPVVAASLGHADSVILSHKGLQSHSSGIPLVTVVMDLSSVSSKAYPVSIRTERNIRGCQCRSVCLLHFHLSVCCAN